MDGKKVGDLICSLRKEKDMTQREIAEALHVSDKTISKWERGIGIPDVSLLRELSNILGVNIEKILEGELVANQRDNGNITSIKFYVCPHCENVLTSTGKGEISCCGRKVSQLPLQPMDKDHEIKVVDADNDFYVTMGHEMSKAHYISFFAFVSYDRITMVKLYPEQSAEVRFQKIYRGKVFAYCNQHGLQVVDIKRE
ncbi:helix-turn-helix domain-containing protein [Radiobacillus deserti]|uniref:Helix-turn-helix domain-containing protein n=1 Tax=Radiobacillus deserti TaxID=2594883 RepID=A0A516KC54_9BACI|nr:helix-turn-helix domain-containing protein [Radiobacillus deserti]QDP38964.1 helix-turn-helix domain-containing protein [Radiobacillus deserti]